jgi:hypothetical protein
MAAQQAASAKPNFPALPTKSIRTPSEKLSHGCKPMLLEANPLGFQRKMRSVSPNPAMVMLLEATIGGFLRKRI